MTSLPDPRTQYARPPFNDQQPTALPGSIDNLNPKADHGEDSYTGAKRLEGLRALITGGDSGIGRAVAIAFAREGADVAINYLSEESDAAGTIEIVKKCGVKGYALGGDLTDESFCKSLVHDAHSKLGGLDILINNAAFQETRDAIDEFSTELFDKIYKTNVYAPFWLSREAINLLPAGGSIINTVSIQAYSPTAELLPYATTKSALVGMTKAMAKLAMSKGVRINGVAPGPVWTPLIPGSMDIEKARHFGENTLFERPAQPVELAPLFVWLASPAASYVTAEIYGATGGSSPF